MKWLAVAGLAIWAVVLVWKWATPLDPEPPSADEDDPRNYQDHPDWPTWFEETL